MNNLIIDSLVETVIIGGTEYEINSDFRTSLIFEMMIKDSSIENNEKIHRTIDLYYSPQIIKSEYIEEAFDKALWFFRCGKEIKQGKGKGKKTSKISYSYDQDDELIFAAFLGQYRINLVKEEHLHWWEFKALFNSLHDNNKICEVMSIRNKDLSKIKDKEEKAYYKEMQAYYKIEEETTEEDLKALEEWNNIL